MPLDQARVLVWIGAGPGGFPELTDDIEWVALKTAGIEAFVGAGVIDAKRLWTNASGFYAEGVAEHALALLLAGLRQINTSVLRHWDKQPIDTGVRTLRGARVAIVGAGGIGASLIPRLTACGASTIAVNRSGRPVEGAALTLPADRLDEVWAQTDHVVLAAPSTPETRHLINERSLAALPDHAWIVNVARGPPHRPESAVQRAARRGDRRGRAGCDRPRTAVARRPAVVAAERHHHPHIANPASGLTREMAPFLAENVRRFTAGEALIAPVSADRDY